MPGLNIQVTANVQNANQGLQSLQQNLAKTAAASNAFGGSMAKNVNSVNAAGFALTNLGRVAQDAPFGFIAIQNNLNPLLESFQRLQSQTGSVVGTFKALGASLIGAGGIGLALSVVSSILIRYPDLFATLTKEEIAARDALKSYNEEVGKEQASLQTELTKMSSLVQVARDYSETTTARKAAIDELQRLYPGYLQNINQENINSQATQQAIDNLTAALTRKAKVQAISNLLTKAEEDLYKAQNSTVNDNLDAWEKVSIAVKNFGNLGSGAMDAVGKAAKNQSANIDLIQKNVSSLSAELDALTRGQAENNDFKLFDPEKLKKTKERIDQVAEVLRKLAIDRDQLAANPLIPDVQKPRKDIELIQSAITRLLDLKVPKDSTIIAQLVGDIGDFNGGDIRKLLNVELPAMIRKEAVKHPLTMTIPADVNLDLKAASKTLSDAQATALLINERRALEKAGRKVFNNQGILSNVKLLNNDEVHKNFSQLQEDIKGTAAVMQNVLDPVFSAAFENIGKGSQSAFQAIGDAIKGVITQLIRAAAEAAVLSLILNAIGFGGGNSFNDLFGRLTGIGAKIPKFAEGGIAYGPTVGLFAEYQNASTNPEVIAPLDRLKSLIGNNQNSPEYIEVRGNIRGSNIFLSNARTQVSRRRIYGK